MPQNRIDVEPNATLALGGKLTEAQVGKYFYSDNSDYEVVLKADRVKLEKAGSDVAYEQVMAAVSDFEKGNMRLSVVLQSLQ